MEFSVPGPSDKRMVTLEGWDGVNNVVGETAMPTNHLLEAVNVDFDSEGRVQRRRGTTLALGLPRARSLWSGNLFPYMLVAQDTHLIALNEDLKQTVVSTTLNPAADITYCEVNGSAYWSDGSSIGLLTPDLVTHPIYAENPPVQPLCAAVGTGGMDQGRYQVAITWVDELGRESGTPLANSVAVADGGGIQLTMPVAPGHIPITRIYLTKANGDKLYFYRTIPSMIGSVLIGAGKLQAQLATQFHEPMPAGHLVRYFNGRLFVADHDRVWFSRSLAYGQFHRPTSYMKFRGLIRMLEGVGEAQNSSGFYVSDEARVYYRSGASPKDFQQTIAYPYPAVEGTAVVVPGSYLGLSVTTNVVYWLSTNGVFCIGLPGGSVEPFSENYLLASKAQSGASYVRDIDGIRQIVTNLSGIGAPQTAAASVTAVASVVRNGVVVQ